jgi:hypothetical protein
MTLMYVEYIDRDRATPIEVFRQLGNQSSSWSESSIDKLAFQLGRTMRLGPHPSYLAGWEIPGLERLDQWEDYFHSPAALTNRRSQAMHRAIHIQRAGLYEVLLNRPKPDAALFVIEYWNPADEAQDVQARLTKRQERHSEVQLQYGLQRLGALGPEPPILAVWSGPSYAAFESLFADERVPDMKLVTCGVYRSFGEEVL